MLVVGCEHLESVLACLGLERPRVRVLINEREAGELATSRVTQQSMTYQYDEW